MFVNRPRNLLQNKEAWTLEVHMLEGGPSPEHCQDCQDPHHSSSSVVAASDQQTTADNMKKDRFLNGGTEKGHDGNGTLGRDIDPEKVLFALKSHHGRYLAVTDDEEALEASSVSVAANSSHLTLEALWTCFQVSVHRKSKNTLFENLTLYLRFSHSLLGTFTALGKEGCMGAEELCARCCPLAGSGARDRRARRLQ